MDQPPQDAPAGPLPARAVGFWQDRPAAYARIGRCLPHRRAVRLRRPGAAPRLSGSWTTRSRYAIPAANTASATTTPSTIAGPTDPGQPGEQRDAEPG